ncbi:MAG: class III signal peptide-containing protein [Candidatus Marsarchaeota archaeon]|nr:class III signal peptide-containing protein [Candidatus Marsarchaeota archaeon]
MSGKRGQGAFEYILLLAGVLLIVILIIVILKSVVLSPANANIQGTNEILNTISQIPEVPGAWTKFSCSTPVISFLQNPTINVIYVNGVYYAFYSNETGGPTGQGNIGVLNSTNGINWTVMNDSILNPSPTGWDNNSIGVPVVIYDSNDNEFKMWYMGSNNTNVDSSWQNDPGQSIGYATSPNVSINWVKYQSNPVFFPNSTGTWDNVSIAPSMAIIKDGDTYKMWYSAKNSTGDFNTSVGYATSADGITWTRWNGTGGPVIANMISIVVLKNSVYYMSLGSLNVNFPDFVTEASTSADGITWTAPYATLTSTPGCWDSGSINQSFINSIIFTNGQYEAWYYGNNGGGGGFGYLTAPPNILTS